MEMLALNLSDQAGKFNGSHNQDFEFSYFQLALSLGEQERV